MNDLQEQLSCARIEDEDGSINGFGGEIAFECFVDGDTVHVRVVHEPNDLIGKHYCHWYNFNILYRSQM